VQHMMFVIILCAFVVWLTMRLGLWILFFAIAGLIAGAIGLAVILVRRGSTQQESLLWALAIASERSLPLAPAALAFADQFAGSVAGRFAYLGLVLVHIEVVISFIIYFIAPKYEAIFKDFGLSLPAMTIYTLMASHFLVRYFPIMLFLLFAQVFFFGVLPLGLVSLSRWDIPFLHIVFKR